MHSAALLTICVCLAIIAIQNIGASKTRLVTCGSVVKLLNVEHRVRLHSHDVKYGTGSGQQSVTGTELQEDTNSHWLITGENGVTCQRGTPIKCGDRLRLQHMATKRLLHSHHFESPLSAYQEISCYGDNGIGDTGDNWELLCDTQQWLRDQPVRLRHMDTGSLLAASGRTFGRPINGQMEIVGAGPSYHGVHWKTAEGLFVHPGEEAKSTHDEL